MVATNRYYDYTDRLDDGPSPEPDVTDVEMFVFLALTIQTRHGVTDKLTGYWSTVDQLYTHTFLWHYDAMGPIPSHPLLLKFF